MYRRRQGSACGRRRAISGVTLIELMIVITVVGILAVISVPAYRGYAERAHRTEAQNALNRMVTAQAQYRLTNNTFTDDLDALGFPGGCSENCVYMLDFTVAPDTSEYTARARPTPGGGTNNVDQTGDDDCQWFTISSRGLRDGGPGDNCWGG